MLHITVHHIIQLQANGQTKTRGKIISFFLCPFLIITSTPTSYCFPILCRSHQNSSPSSSHFLHHVKTVPSRLFFHSFIPHALLTFSLFSPIFFSHSFYLSVLLSFVSQYPSNRRKMIKYSNISYQ